MMAAQPWRYTKNLSVVYFKWVSFMTHKLYLNKDVIKNKTREDEQ